MSNPNQPCTLCGENPCVVVGIYNDLVEHAEELMGERNEEEERDDQLTAKEIRFRLYRLAIWLLHGHLGRGNRKRLPRCVMGEIRDLFPNRPGVSYVNFKGNDENNNDN